MNNEDFGLLLNDKIPDELPKFWDTQLPKYVASTGLDLEYSRKELAGTLKWVIHEWVLELENTNWSYIRQQGGNPTVSRELKHIADRAWDYAFYWVEKSFGYEDEGSRPRTEGEKFGAALWEAIITKPNDEFFGQMGTLRQVEFLKSKRVTRRFLYDIENWIRLQITRYGGSK